MPYWSIAEWRARIGSSWCALGRPVKSKSSYRCGSGWVRRVLTLNQVVTMMITMIMLIGVNLALHGIISGGYYHPLTNLLQVGAASPILYLLQSGYLLLLALRNSAPLLYQLFPAIIKQSVEHLCSDLIQTLCFSSCVLRRLLILISPLIHPVQWLILFVVFRLDWLKAVSMLMKTLEAKHGVVNENELRKRCDILRWLAVAKALLDTVLSVAASVIISKLLISGDVEKNPGPGELDYNNVDASQILEADDLIDVKEEVLSIKSRYYYIGQSLRLVRADLINIRDKYRNEPDIEEALEEVLLLWLDKKYNTEKFGPPTWRKLVEAVDRKGGGNNHQLAKEIASKHPTGGSSQSPAEPKKHQESDSKEVPLGIDDMREVLDFFWDFRAKWKMIGIDLHIDMGTLDSIEEGNRNKPDKCLVEVIKVWLHGTTSKANPTRSTMFAVLQSKCVAGGATPTKAHVNSNIYAQYLKSIYKVKTLADSSEDQWPPPVTDKIFRLAMIRTEEQVRRIHRGNLEDDLVRKKSITGKVDDVLKRKIPIQLEAIFKEIQEQRKSVLIEGAPGSGKSTLSIHICHQWTEGTLFQQYSLVILVRLRESSVQNAKRIAELLPRCNESMGSDAEEEITNMYGRSVLFILDGWDELPKKSPAYPMILHLIEGKTFPESSIVITSRPTSSVILHALVSLRIEILGFTRDELHRYFMKCLQNSHQAVEALLQRIRQNPIIEGSCYLPLNASILVHLFKCGGNVLPTTQYGIFTELVCSCIYRHLKKTTQDINELKSLNELPPEVDGPFQELCQLAYSGIMEDRVVFELSSDFNTLGLLQGVESFAIRGKSYSFNFLHLTIQELLAAIYMATNLEDKEQTEQFNKLFGKLRFAAVFQFFAAKTKLRTSGISDIVKQVATSGDKALLVSLIYCLFEAQDSSLCQLVADELKQSLNISETSLTPADCYCLGYFLTYCKDFTVHLRNCTIANKHCKCLFRQGEVYNLRHLE